MKKYVYYSPYLDEIRIYNEPVFKTVETTVLYTVIQIDWYCLGEL